MNRRLKFLEEDLATQYEQLHSAKSKANFYINQLTCNQLLPVKGLNNIGHDIVNCILHLLGYNVCRLEIYQAIINLLLL